MVQMVEFSAINIGSIEGKKLQAKFTKGKKQQWGKNFIFSHI